MDYTKVLKRAWQIVWNYRVLWVLGFILALVASEGGGNGFQYTFGRGDFPPSGQGPAPEIPPEVMGMVATVVVGLICVGILLAIVFAVVRYVMETALIRMVDEHEKTGEKQGFRQGVRMGWSRSALRMFLIDLLVDIPVAVVFTLLFLLAFAPMLLWLIEADAPRAIGTGTTVCLAFLAILLAIIVGVVLTALRSFFWRACVLEELGVIDSIRRGYAVVRQRLVDVVVMLLITAGLDLVWALVMIPIALLLVILGVMVAAVPALLVGGLASLFLQAEEAVPWILVAVVALPIFILVLAVPLTFLDGLMKVFQSTTWTLTYRELQTPES